MAFQKPDKPVKSLWHSEAVTFGPTLCFVKSGPTNSKNPQNPPYFTIEIGGRERYYNAENPHCQSVLVGLVGRKTMLEFTGNRDSASIQCCGAGADQRPAPDPENDGREEAPPQDFQQQPPRERTPAPRQPALTLAQQESDDLKKGRHTLMRLGNVFLINMGQAEWIAEQHRAKYPNRVLTSDNICSIAATLTIGGERQGVQNLMPEHPIETAPKQTGGAK